MDDQHPAKDSTAGRNAPKRLNPQPNARTRGSAPITAIRLNYAAELPVSLRREEILAALRANQVLIVAGQTGSGKTTQLPKMCLEALGLVEPGGRANGFNNDRPRRGIVGHTQPRRIAARSVASRLAEEMGTSVGNRRGDRVGFKVRFTDQTGPDALIKVMTDGVLLAETRSDPLLRAYSAIIVDEAHERSLNIDFLIGYLKQLLISGRRPDLKVVITSATIDTARFAHHFARQSRASSGHGQSELALLVPAPVIEVSGRMFPVEVRYLPPLGNDDETTERGPAPPQWTSAARDRTHPLPSRDVEVEDVDLPREVLRAVDQLVRGELAAELDAASMGSGGDNDRRDILVFLPGEREIREAADTLRKHYPAQGRTALDIVPLYARLSAEEQHRVFRIAQDGRRRVILATNVAETSLTVPGIGAVIDTGLVRMSRYSARQKVQRLPIEWVSRASAEQRRGRAGRLGPGICLRLYAESAFANRPEFTEPEILRTNLASVILQMMALFGQRPGSPGQRLTAAELLRFRGIESFPFLDPPDHRMIRDGYETLVELGAIEPRTVAPPASAVPAACTPASSPAPTTLSSPSSPSSHAPSPPPNRLQAGPTSDSASTPNDEDDAARGYQLTSIGRDLARFPVDPRLGRMVLAARERSCVEEVLVIVAATSIQDPRQRPGKDRPEMQRLADEAHAKFKDSGSDFLGWLALWRAYREQSAITGSNKLRKWCKDHHLNFLRMREWEDIHQQLRRLLGELGYATPLSSVASPAATRPITAAAASMPKSPHGTHTSNAAADDEPQADDDVLEDETRHYEVSEEDSPEAPPPEPRTHSSSAKADQIHRAILSGLVTSVGRKSDQPPAFEYEAPRGVRFAIFPGSALFRVNPKWVMAGEIVKTTRLYARSVAAVRPDWIEHAAAHLVKRTHSDPRWDPSHQDTEGGRGRGTVIANERVTLHGLELAKNRVVEFGPIDPEQSRAIFIHHALVSGEYVTDAPWFEHNRRLIKRVADLENRARRTGLLVDAVRRYAFYEQRTDPTVWSARSFEEWRRRAERQNARVLFMSVGDLLEEGAELPRATDFPESLASAAPFGEPLNLPLEYRFDPADERDGVTVTIPASEAERFDPVASQWLVPGLLREKVTELIRTLPRNLRTSFVPAPEFADRALETLMPRFGRGDLLVELAERLTAITGTRVPNDAWRSDDLPNHLRMHFRVVADQDPSRVLAEGRDWSIIRRALSHKVRDALASLPPGRFNRDGITSWDFNTPQPAPEASQSFSQPSTQSQSQPDTRAQSQSEANPVATSQSPSPVVDARNPNQAEFPRELIIPTPTVKVDRANRAPSVERARFMTVYPALIDPSSTGRARGVSPGPPARSVAVRLFDDPKRSVPAMHLGLRRLLMIQLSGQTTSLVGLYPGVDRLAVAYASLAGGQQLKAQLAELVGIRAFDEIAAASTGLPGARSTIWHGGEIRSKQAFDAAVETGWNRLGSAAEEVMTLTADVLNNYRAVAPAIVGQDGQWHGPRAWANAIADMREQLSMLVYPGFLVGVPWKWLRQYPRYLRAIAVRLERLANDGPERDLRLMAQTAPFWSAFREAERARQTDPKLQDLGDEPELEEFGWMVEEFRVSTFAQSLQTAMPVSHKRLLAQWEKARAARERLMQTH